MKTVMVTRFASVPPTRRSVWSISANTRCVWASKLPAMSLPSPSTVAVWPASQTTRPPSVMTAGEYARVFCASVPSRYFAMSAPLAQPQDRASARPAAALQSDAPRGGGDRIDAAVARHAAVITLGALGGNVAAVEIALHLVRWTIERIAVAGAAGQPKLENLVGCRERHERADAVVVDDPARRIEHHTAHGSTRATAEEARGPRQHPVGVQAGECRKTVVEKLADANDLAETAPMTARAAGVGDQAFLEDEHRRARLEELDGRVRGAGRPEQRRLPVAVRPRPLTAALEEVVVVDAAVGSDAVCQQRGRKAREGLDLVRDRARQRHEDIGGDVPAGARARVDGHRFGAVHDAALGRDDRERAVGAGVGGHARGQNALERVRGVGGGVAEGAVRPTAQGLRRRAREVDGDRVAAHDDL